ncbi:purine-nucleoside phosphorylase [candidate division WOR-3 bacterium]|nr:purine-nucleoside phosphorylase [candidate division WOR-3 bacterium]
MNYKAFLEHQIIQAGANWLDEKGAGKPEVLVILGSGLSGILKSSSVIDLEVRMKEVPGLFSPTAPTHEGVILFGDLCGKRAALMNGRLHHYEGFSEWEIVRALRMISWLGTKILIVTNSAGGLRKDMKEGEVMVITDQLNLQCKNPLIGPNIDVLGQRFPLLAHAYTPDFVRIADDISMELNMKIHFGVYAAVLGPSFETAAETKMLQLLGADAVGMSTVSEVIAAAHMGMDVLGMSVITNINDPDSMMLVDEESMNRYAAIGGKTAEELILNFLEKIGERNENGE